MEICLLTRAKFGSNSIRGVALAFSLILICVGLTSAQTRPRQRPGKRPAILRSTSPTPTPTPNTSQTTTTNEKHWYDRFLLTMGVKKDEVQGPSIFVFPLIGVFAFLHIRRELKARKEPKK